jgi:hypothetical protein
MGEFRSSGSYSFELHPVIELLDITESYRIINAHSQQFSFFDNFEPTSG